MFDELNEIEERSSRKVFLFQVNFPTTQIAIDRLLLFYAVKKDGKYAQYKLTIYCKKGGKHFVFPLFKVSKRRKKL